jgi:hypothetical protein
MLATASVPDRIPVEASPASTHFVIRRETRSTTFRVVRGAGMTSAISGNDLLAAIELPRIRQHPPLTLSSTVLAQAYDVACTTDPGVVRQ